MSGVMSEGSLRAVLGGFGGGKSLYMAQCMVEGYRDGYRKVITNCPLHVDAVKAIMPELEVRVCSNKEMQTWWTLGERGVMVFVDEAHLVWKSRQWKEILDADVAAEQYLSQIRKTGDRVIIVTQRWKDIMAFLRDRVQMATFCWKLPIPFYTIFVRTEWFCAQGNFTSRKKFVRFVPWFWVADFAKLYDTHALVGKAADNVAVEREKKKANHLVWVVPLAFVAAGFYLSWHFGLINLHQGKAAASAPALASPVRRFPATFPAPVVRLVFKPTWDGLHYVSPDGEVTGLDDDWVTVSDPRSGRVYRFARDWHSEYASIGRQQDHAARSSLATGATAIPARGGH